MSDGKSIMRNEREEQEALKKWHVLVETSAEPPEPRNVTTYLQIKVGEWQSSKIVEIIISRKGC